MAYKFTLSSELEKRAKYELNEDPKRRIDDIEHIRNWINKQPHLNAKTDDWSILQFLRGCKFSLEKTKKKIDMHYTLKTALPLWFTNRDVNDPKITQILKMGLLVPLRGVDNEGRRVLLYRTFDIEAANITINVLMRALYCVIDVLREDDELQSITGAVMLNDMSEFRSSQMFLYTPTLTKKMMVVWQDGYPTRPKGLHYLNVPSTFEGIFNFFKTFMTAKMIKRISIHANYESLYKILPKSILPEEYGGTDGKIQDIVDYWYERVMARRDWLIEEEQFRVDESKRPGTAKNSNDLFGIDGSFRTLSLD